MAAKNNSLILGACVFALVVAVGLGGVYGPWAFSVRLTTGGLALARHGILIVGGASVRRSDGELIRIADIEAPRMPPNARCAKEARLAVRALNALANRIAWADQVTVVPLNGVRDENGHLLGRVIVDERDVGDLMIASGLAHATGRPKSWCSA